MGESGEYNKIYLKKQIRFAKVKWFGREMLEEAMDLREKIIDSLEDKNLFAKAIYEDFDRYIKDGFGLVCYDDKKMIACIFCISSNVDYAVDIKYSSEKIDKCVDLDDVYVDLEYRGNELQILLMNMIAEICEMKGKEFILATVAHNNQISYDNFLKAGYKEVDRMQKYGGLDRIFMEKQL